MPTAPIGFKKLLVGSVVAKNEGENTYRVHRPMLWQSCCLWTDVHIGRLFWTETCSCVYCVTDTVGFQLSIERGYAEFG
jgi:hypothetical protein